MKTKTFAILFALVMVLSMAVGVFAQDFTETWDENTVLTVFNDFEMVFPDMFADEDSDFIWTDNGPADFPANFPNAPEKAVIAKAPIEEDTAEMTATYDPCGDGLIKYDVTIFKGHQDPNNPGYDLSVPEAKYYGDKNTTYIRDILAQLTVIDEGGSSSSFKLGVKTCESTGGDGCHSVTFKKASDGSYQAHLKGYLTVPYGIVMTKEGKYAVDMAIDFSDYMTALWDVVSPKEGGTAIVSASTDDGKLTYNGKRNYCQDSLEIYNGLGYEIRAAYDENTGEARLQTVIRNYQPDVRKQNYVIPAEVFAFTGEPYLDKETNLIEFANAQRITDYTCKYTIYNVANAAPRTDYCKFGEGIAIPNHGMVRIDLTIDHLSGDILRAAKGGEVEFALRLGGMNGLANTVTGVTVYNITGQFKAVDFPCPKVSRMQVMDPLKPFMSFYKVLKSDGAIKPSGAYGVYEGGVWGMYQKCGKLAYMMVRLKNDGLDDEIVNLDHTAVAINGGTPMKWNWIMTTVDPEKGNKIVLEAGKDVILIGRAKVTDVPSQLNADTAMTGAVNFTDFGFYITGKVYYDHNNTRCVAAPK